MEQDRFVTLKQGDLIIEDKYTEAEYKKRRKLLSRASSLGLLLVFAVMLFFIKPNIKFAYTMSSSMVPTLSVGDLALYGPIGTLDRGDIVIFEPVTETEVPPILAGKETFFEKRLIGLPGEAIRMEDGVVYINGEPLDEPYAVYSNEDAASVPRDIEELVIPDGCYFVMGDNRDVSADSRAFGVVPYENFRYELVFSMPSIAGLVTGAGNDDIWLG